VSTQLLLVDDEQPVLDGLRRTLRAQGVPWELTCVDRAEAAWQRLLESAYDAVVTDIKMPGMSGLELLQRIRQSDETRDLPVVVLTGLSDNGLKQRALELGASDLFNKPVDPGQLIARLHSVLALKANQDMLKARIGQLRQELLEQSLRLVQARLAVVCRLGNVAEYRDEETGNHVIRVACYSREVGARLGLGQAVLETLLLAAPLHDIGKIGIPDAILLKQGPLTPGERAVIQRHCVIGERILREDSKVLAPFLDYCPAWWGRELPSDPVLEMAATIALSHHEKWDGTGYPMGLRGVDIPLEARIVAICDVFDALTSRRPYKLPANESEAIQTVTELAGSHFDPTVYRAFMDALPVIRSVRERFADHVRVFADKEDQWP